MALEEKEFTETNLNELIDIVERDAIPTNEFTTQDIDKYVLLGKLNEIEQHLRNISGLVSNSDTKANNALEQAIKAIQNATTALDSSNLALDSSNTALATANEAISTANNALENVVVSIDTSNEAKEIAQNALNLINDANTKADNAVSVANSALSTANTANINAFDAEETANNADLKADNAVSVANNANTKADDANTKADNANTKADNAVSVANSANTTANNADASANEAKEIANSALNQVVSGLGTKVMVAGILQSVFDADTKADKTELSQYLSKLGGEMLGDITMHTNTNNSSIYLEEGQVRGNSNGGIIISAPKGIYLRPNNASSGKSVILTGGVLRPEKADDVALGSSSIEWSEIRGKAIYQNGEAVANQSDLNATNANVTTNANNIATLNTDKANQSDLNETNKEVGKKIECTDWYIDPAMLSGDNAEVTTMSYVHISLPLGKTLKIVFGTTPPTASTGFLEGAPSGEGWLPTSSDNVQCRSFKNTHSYRVFVTPYSGTQYSYGWRVINYHRLDACGFNVRYGNNTSNIRFTYLMIGVE